MAQGDVIVFERLHLDSWKGVHNLDTDTIKVALVGNGITPTATTSDPRWGAGGGTNFAAQQVSPGGNYVSGGTDISGTVFASTPFAVFDGITNPSWTKDPAGPTGIYWAIMYNDTVAGKQAILAIEMGTNVSNVDSHVSITFDANGILRVSTV